ncbi:hypothetical protein [Desulfovibrio sp. JC010]|uniref:hypothetical protein n=1 Tax=Desulfovibrio sp. JC010 TaxID=2593641 RepID=UPI0013D35524|nr:hypothetical protein [Desulfovibrio sp. JC010]NDV27529.1 hypothetical protein [Desulfovibrio sp. JC010]
MDQLEEFKLVRICQGKTFELPTESEESEDDDLKYESIRSFFLPKLELISIIQSHLSGKIDLSSLQLIRNPISVKKIWKAPVKGKKGKKRRQSKFIPYEHFEGEIVLHDLNGFKFYFSSEQQEGFITAYNTFLSKFHFSMDELTPEQQYGLEMCRRQYPDAFRFPYLRRSFNYDESTGRYFA